MSIVVFEDIEKLAEGGHRCDCDANIEFKAEDFN